MAADGEIVIDTSIDVSKADKELAKLKTKIENLEKSIAKDTTKQGGLSEDAAKAAGLLDEAKAKLYEMKSASKGVFSKEDISEQQQRVNLLQSDYNRIDNSLQRVNIRLKDSNTDLEQMKTEAGQLQGQIDAAAKNTSLFKSGMDKAGRSVEAIEERIKRLAKRVLFFSVITSALRGLRSWLGNVIKASPEASAAIAKLKGALLTMVQPLVDIVIPAFVTLVNVLTQVVGAIASLMANLFGKTVEQSAEAAKNLNDEQKALKGVGSAAKKAGKNLASFDEINKVASEGNSGGAAQSEISPDFSFNENPLEGAAGYLTGAALLVMGAILTFSGANIPLGLGMMVAGAATLYAAMQFNSGAISELLNGTLGTALVIAGMAAIAIGILLVCTGNIGLGLGLIALGAMSLFTVAAFAPETFNSLISSDLFSNALVIVGIVAIGIGILLICTGHVGLGLGAIVLGAISLFTAYQFNPTAVSELLTGDIFTSAIIVVGIVAVGLGIFLLCSGNIGLGLGAIALGATALFAETAFNGDKVRELVEGPLGTALVVVGYIAIALGVLLLCSGNIGLGLGLIGIGAASLFTVAAFDENKISKLLQGPIGLVMAVISASLLVIGVILLFTGAGIPLGLGLLAVGAAGLAAAIAPNWGFIVDKITEVKNGILKVLDDLKTQVKKIINSIIGFVEGLVNKVIDAVNWIISALNTIHFELPDWLPGDLGGKSFGINIPLRNKITLPRLAQGAVIPPNREFLAVLGDQKSGTNIETPLATMVQAFRQALSEGGYGGGEQTINLIVNLDGEVVYQNQQKIAKRHGASFAGVMA